MIHIRPVSDLRNKFPEIEKLVNEGNPVFLTKNGYGSSVLMSIEHFSAKTGLSIDYIQKKLDEANQENEK